MHDLTLVYTVTGALAVALLFGWVTQWLGLSTLVGYLLAGIAVGPHTPGFVADAELAGRLAEIGVILLMFSVGMHFDLRDLLRVRRVAEPGAIAFARVKADKEREAASGHDGTWVAHPALVPVALEAFDRLMPTANQIKIKRRDDVKTSAADLVRFEPEQPITEKGLRLNINVAIQYIGAWLAGQGAVPIFNLMEDAATAEISRSQVWQWIRSPKGRLDDGRKVTRPMVAAMIPEELEKIAALLGPAYGEGRYPEAAEIFAKLVDDDDFVEFLTLPAYERID